MALDALDAVNARPSKLHNSTDPAAARQLGVKDQGTCSQQPGNSEGREALIAFACCAWAVTRRVTIRGTSHARGARCMHEAVKHRFA